MNKRLAAVASTILLTVGIVDPALGAPAPAPITAYADARPNDLARKEGRAIVSLEQVGDRLTVKHRHVAHASQASAYAAQLRAQPGVVAADVDQPVRAFGVGMAGEPINPLATSAGEISAQATASNDTFRKFQWAFDYFQIESVWNHARGDGRLIAVIDSGVDGNHPDLVGQVVSGRDYVQGTDGRYDPYGHGTHVAGTMVAVSNNGQGIASIAPAAKVLPVRVLNDHGDGFESDLAAGIIYAADAGAAVINLSLGGPTTNSAVASAVDYAINKDIVVVAASGNEATTTNAVNYPCAYNGVVCVGAVDTHRNVAAFSNYNAHVDLVAPGVDIASTANGDYYWSTGTSMAAPHVGAVAALLRQRFPRLSQSQIAGRLTSTALDRGAAGRDDHYGHGFVDPLAALSRTPLPTISRPTDGYWLTAADGGVFSFGNVPFYGSTGGMRLNRPIVGMAATANGLGYRFVASDGGVFTFGDAPFFGSTGSLTLNQPIVGMANTPTGKGYWLVASDGGIFSFGDASFFGSAGSLKLNRPVVGMAPTPTGKGYWLVASDGGIFSFGDARFHGSTGAIKLNQPVVGMAPTEFGNGYWLVASDGGVFSFGDALFLGSAVGRASRIRSLTAYGEGYVMADSNGKAYGFGDALAIPGMPNGPDVSLSLNQPVVGGAVAVR